MNRWQQTYCDEYFNGKIPKTKQSKFNVELLGKVKSTITVELPSKTQTFIVTENDCDIPNNKISVRVLVSNLNLWLSRGYKITTN